MKKMSKFSISKEAIDGTEFNVLRKNGYRLKELIDPKTNLQNTYRIDNTKELWYTDDEKQELLDLIKG